MSQQHDSFLTPLNESEALINRVAENLAWLGQAFYETGNEQVSKKLGIRIFELNEAVSLLKKGRDMALEKFVYGAEQRSRNVLDAVFVGAGIDPKTGKLIKKG